MEIFGFAFPQEQLALLGVVGSLVLALIGIIATRGTNRANTIRLAVHAYKSAFAPEIAAIANGSYAIDTFSGAFQRHQAAVDTIRPILPKRHQRKLQKAWDEYRGKGTDIECSVFISGSSTHHDLYPDFKKRFCDLHGCLDGLL